MGADEKENTWKNPGVVLSVAEGNVTVVLDDKSLGVKELPPTRVLPKFDVDAKQPMESHTVNCKHCGKPYCGNPIHLQPSMTDPALGDLQRAGYVHEEGITDCGMTKKLLQKNKEDEEASLKFLRENMGDTKKCPKCKRVVAKNMGCKHMTCARPCLHQWCWGCMGDWTGIFKHEHCRGNGEHSQMALSSRAEQVSTLLEQARLA